MRKYLMLFIACALSFNLSTGISCALEKSTGTAVNQVKNNNAANQKDEKSKKVSKQKKTIVKKMDKKIIVYYFHGDYRCSNCYKIEQYSKEAVETYFPDELKSGKIEYRTVNYDKIENTHYINDYGLYTKSLVVALVENNKEIKNKNLTGVWNYLNSMEDFYNYVKSEVNQYLSEAKQ